MLTTQESSLFVLSPTFSIWHIGSGLENKRHKHGLVLSSSSDPWVVMIEWQSLSSFTWFPKFVRILIFHLFRYQAKYFWWSAWSSLQWQVPRREEAKTCSGQRQLRMEAEIEVMPPSVKRWREGISKDSLGSSWPISSELCSCLQIWIHFLSRPWRCVSTATGNQDSQVTNDP